MTFSGKTPSGIRYPGLFYPAFRAASGYRARRHIVILARCARASDWFEQSFHNRLSVGGHTVCIQSRLHEADAAGTILNDATEWPMLRIDT